MKKLLLLAAILPLLGACGNDVVKGSLQNNTKLVLYDNSIEVKQYICAQYYNTNVDYGIGKKKATVSYRDYRTKKTYTDNINGNNITYSIMDFH